MRRVDRRIAIAGLGASFLSACAGPVKIGEGKKPPRGGIGGTGIVGVVTDFGSIILNGLRVVTTAETQVTDAFGPVDPDSVQIGHSLTVEASTVDGGLVARRVHISHPVIGKVERVRGRTARVGGVRVVMERNAIGKMRRGRTVAVSGLWKGNTVIGSRVDDVEDPGLTVIAGVIDQSRLGGPVSIGGQTFAFGADVPPVGSFATIGGKRSKGRFAPAWITPGRFFGSAGPLEQLSIEGYLEPSKAAPFFTVSGLGHSFDRDAKLRQLKDQRTLFSGPYVGTFAVSEGLPLPADQEARRDVVRQILAGSDVPEAISTR